VICDPLRRSRFNYHIEHAIELKLQFTPGSLAEEIKKLRSYPNRDLARWAAALQRVRFNLPEAGDVTILHAGAVLAQPQPRRSQKPLDYLAARRVTRQVIEECLGLYGSSRQQFHGFYWCNYEHELSRAHSYPCEGDFVAHLYHRLRCALPHGVEIRSEVRPPGRNQRVDIVVLDAGRSWCVPIDVKMNWDQFKPKFKAGARQSSEASLIVDRLRALCKGFERSDPLVVVIQGSWQSGRDIRAEARPALLNAGFRVELVEFDEDDEVVRWTPGEG
jgi:hypothetical protein